jgi:hypothetical protein
MPSGRNATAAISGSQPAERETGYPVSIGSVGSAAHSESEAS